jgi:hypothetical protein
VLPVLAPAFAHAGLPARQARRRPHRSFRRKPRHTKIGYAESQAADSNRPGCRRYAPHRGHFRRGLINPGAFLGVAVSAARADRCGCAPAYRRVLSSLGSSRFTPFGVIGTSRIRPIADRLLSVCAEILAVFHATRRAEIIPCRHPGKDTSLPPPAGCDPPCLGPRRHGEPKSFPDRL